MAHGRDVIVKCPYCGFDNHIHVYEPEENHPKTILCDSEEGGCDKYFAATITFVPVVVTYEMSIADVIHQEAAQ